MIITYLGHSSFKIKTKTATVVTDPYDQSVGFDFPKTQADIVTVSHQHQDHNNLAGIKNITNPQPDLFGPVESDCFVVSRPGEYEIKDISIIALKTYHDEQQGAKRGPNLVICLKAEGITVCHLGDLGHELSKQTLEKVNGVDILLIPIGGIYTIGPKIASTIVSKIEPKIIIPMHFKTARHNPKIFNDLKQLIDFQKEIAVEKIPQVEKLKISKSDIPSETTVITLSSKLG